MEALHTAECGPLCSQVIVKLGVTDIRKSRRRNAKELKRMTQAELAGGTIDARQASPAKGQLIRDFTLTSTLGQEISLSDYRGRSNLVLVFVGGGDWQS